jgi:hypothetical protein
MENCLCWNITSRLFLEEGECLTTHYCFYADQKKNVRHLKPAQIQGWSTKMGDLTPAFACPSFYYEENKRAKRMVDPTHAIFSFTRGLKSLVKCL